MKVILLNFFNVVLHVFFTVVSRLESIAAVILYQYSYLCLCLIMLYCIDVLLSLVCRMLYTCIRYQSDHNRGLCCYSPCQLLDINC